jgi:hypothetical protein
LRLTAGLTYSTEEIGNRFFWTIPNSRECRVEQLVALRFTLSLKVNRLQIEPTVSELSQVGFPEIVTWAVASPTSSAQLVFGGVNLSERQITNPRQLFTRNFLPVISQIMHAKGVSLLTVR